MKFSPSLVAYAVLAVGASAREQYDYVSTRSGEAI
jgi:hypothetical protein